MNASGTLSQPFRVALAPEQLWQAINPWTFDWQGAQIGNVTIDLGHTPKPELERKLLDEVGSYGRQIGRIGDALEVLVRHFDQASLKPEERDALAILLGQLAEIRKVKAGAG